MLARAFERFIALFLVVDPVQIYQLTKAPTLHRFYTKTQSPGWILFHVWLLFALITASHGFNLQPWYYRFGWRSFGLATGRYNVAYSCWVSNIAGCLDFVSPLKG